MSGHTHGTNVLIFWGDQLVIVLGHLLCHLQYACGICLHHFRIASCPLWNHFGTIPESIWGQMGVIPMWAVWVNVGQIRDQFGTILELSWREFGVNLQTLWNQLETPFEPSFGYF